MAATLDGRLPFSYKKERKIKMTGCYIPIPVACNECGKAPIIGENGTWWIDGQDTGIRAQGPAGEQGPAGPQGPQGPAGVQGPKGDKGEGLIMDTLFSGAAETVGSVYNLSKPITDYREVLVEVEGFVTNFDGWMKGYETIPYPAVAQTSHQYGCLHYINPKLSVSEPESASKVLVCAYFHFPTASTLCLDYIGKLDNVVNQRVSKVYGVK